MAAVSVISALYELYRYNPFFVGLVCALSLIALFARIIYLLHERDLRKSPAHALDFNLLRDKDVLGYADWLKENVRGHNETIDIILAKIQQNLRLSNPGRTLGSFILVGPTGTGKSFLSELVGMALYPDSEPLVIPMNQYKDRDDVFTLLGPPPGHSGFEVGGSLTRAVFENPLRLVLFDEIEKAHIDVQHCLYDILDKGECREKSSGRSVSFAGCAFFATCNAGVESLRAIYESERTTSLRTARARESLARDAGFERALLARFDEILLLDELKPIDIAQVACLQLAKHWRRYGIEVAYASPELIFEAMLRNLPFKEYGVRQLSRFIKDLTDPSIEIARQSGKSRVRLEVDRTTGRIMVNA